MKTKQTSLYSILLQTVLSFYYRNPDNFKKEVYNFLTSDKGIYVAKLNTLLYIEILSLDIENWFVELKIFISFKMKTERDILPTNLYELENIETNETESFSVEIAEGAGPLSEQIFYFTFSNRYSLKKNIDLFTKFLNEEFMSISEIANENRF